MIIFIKIICKIHFKIFRKLHFDLDSRIDMMQIEHIPFNGFDRLSIIVWVYIGGDTLDWSTWRIYIWGTLDQALQANVLPIYERSERLNISFRSKETSLIVAHEINWHYKKGQWQSWYHHSRTPNQSNFWMGYFWYIKIYQC